MKNDLSLYIHIPFCTSKCNYCSFVSEVRKTEDKKAYISALLKEIELRANEYRPHYNIRTIYIGGGTPSALENGQIREILQCVYKNFSVYSDAEITIELNPLSATKEKIYEYILAGVNRFSIGLQCTNGRVLKAMGRTHTSNDFDDLIKNIRDYGISNINADVMIGYPGQSEIDVKDTVEHLINLKIPHISTYMLQVEDGTKLKRMVDKGVVFLPDEKIVINMYNQTTSMLKKSGYIRYELSNFAVPGYASKHNNVYWDRTDYLGVGVSSHSYICGVRFSNTSKIDTYISIINGKNKAPVVHAKKITKDERREEMIMLSLRTNKGLNVKAYEEEFGENILETKNEELKNLIKLGLVVLDKDGNIKATDAGYLLLNRVILELV